MYPNAMRLRSLLPFIATLAILATWLIFTDARGIANFHADQSLAGLMARRALAGEFTPYVWGQGYFGTLFVMFLMPVEALWPGDVFMMRLPFVVMQVVSVALWLIYVHKHCGRTVAIITGMILSVPSLPALDFLYFHLSSLYLILFFTSLLLLSDVDYMTFRSTVRMFLVGICWGLGLWTTPVFILLIGITCFCMLLQSESWRVLRANCIGMIRLKQREGNLLITFATLTVLLALFLLVFS